MQVPLDAEKRHMMSLIGTTIIGLVAGAFVVLAIHRLVKGRKATA